MLTNNCIYDCAYCINRRSIDINRADYAAILRVPGIGVKSAKLIVTSRRFGRLNASQLKKMGIVMKKAQYFITCNELPMYTVNEATPDYLRKILSQPGKQKKEDRQLAIIFPDLPPPCHACIFLRQNVGRASL